MSEIGGPDPGWSTRQAFDEVHFYKQQEDGKWKRWLKGCVLKLECQYSANGESRLFIRNPTKGLAHYLVYPMDKDTKVLVGGVEWIPVSEKNHRFGKVEARRITLTRPQHDRYSWKLKLDRFDLFNTYLTVRPCR